MPERNWVAAARSADCPCDDWDLVGERLLVRGVTAFARALAAFERVAARHGVAVLSRLISASGFGLASWALYRLAGWEWGVKQVSCIAIGILISYASSPKRLACLAAWLFGYFVGLWVAGCFI